MYIIKIEFYIKKFNNQANNDNQYEQFSNLKNKISDIEEKINLKFPDYFNKTEIEAIFIGRCPKCFKRK